MRTIYFRSSSKFIFDLFMIFCLTTFVIHKMKNIHLTSLRYMYDPWRDYLDTKMFTFSESEPINESSIKDDNSSIIWSPESLNALVEHPTSHCSKLVALGGTWQCNDCKRCARDGHKYVCMDEDVAPIPGDCIIYSFGVGTEMSFDGKMTKFNCSVFAFDMTLVNQTNKVMKENLHLLLIGLSNENYDAYFSMHSEAEPDKYTTVEAAFRTLEVVRRLLNHENRSIDYLKLDIESSEWRVFEQIFKNAENAKVMDGVKQIGLEIHFDDFKNSSALERVEAGMRYEKVLKEMEAHGFHLVHTELNKFAQVFSDVRGKVFPLFRESLFVRR